MVTLHARGRAGTALYYLGLLFVTVLLRSSSSSELKNQRTYGPSEYLKHNIFCVPSASSGLSKDLRLITLFGAARGCLLGLEFAEVGTNSVVRRKTLFESAERADGLRIFFI